MGCLLGVDDVGAGTGGKSIVSGFSATDINEVFDSLSIEGGVVAKNDGFSPCADEDIADASPPVVD